MITIYIRGCSTCGAIAKYRKRAEAYARSKGQSIETVNTLYDLNRRVEHDAYLRDSVGYGDYEPIIVEDGKVTKLRLFNP